MLRERSAAYGSAGVPPASSTARGQDAHAPFDEPDLVRTSGPKGTAKASLEEWLRDEFFALQSKLIAILEGEAPLDIFIHWKPLHQQPIGWNPDINDGVRQNIRPFLLAGDVGAKGAGRFRAKPGIDPTGGKEFVGRRWNTAHFMLARKQATEEGRR